MQQTRISRLSGRVPAPIVASVLVASMSSHVGVAPTHAAETQTAALEEVIVTAQRREESLRSVPMSISAITATELANRGAVRFQDYAVSVPSLSFGYRGGEARGAGNTMN